MKKNDFLKRIAKGVGIKKKIVGGGASKLLKKSSIDLAKGKKYIGGGASKELTQMSKNLAVDPKLKAYSIKQGKKK